MNVDLFTVSYSKDFPYLRHMLRSLDKFCTGFRQLVLLIPYQDNDAAVAMVKDIGLGTEVRFITYEDAPGRGMVQHMAHIMFADTFSDADAFAHIDSDCIFTAPVNARDLFANDKPILRYEPFAVLNRRHPNTGLWQECTQKILPFKVNVETMRCHPGVFLRQTYGNARMLMERVTNIEARNYILAQKNDFPQTFCEFVTLGNVAFTYEPERYYAVRQDGDRPLPDNNLQQFWGHGDINASQRIWVKGVQEDIVPIDFINKTLGVETPHAPALTPEEEEKAAQ